ncbi:MAG: IPT/TIG domain-containing protein [Deltaproteobacteria bacterium]|nr:IPT/TIG domain-containing protein [Deltaproteobacteria bacterium]
MTAPRAWLALLALVGCGRVAAPSSADAFTPVADPQITAVTPDHSPAAGGVLITLRGTGFADAPQVVVDGRLIAAATATDDAITFVAPPGAPGSAVALVVFNQRGLARLADGLHYQPAPELDDVSGPYAGAGGATVTLTGRGFAADDLGPPAITVGGVPVADVTIVRDDLLTFTAPALTAPPVGRADVTLTNHNGTATLARGYRYTRPGLLVTGDRFVDNNNATRVFYLDPDALDPATALVPLGRIAGRFTVRGMAAIGADLWVIVPSLVDGGEELATLDPFSGVLTNPLPIHLADGTHPVVSGLAAQGTRLLTSARCAATVYELDPTGLATPVSAPFTATSCHHKLAATPTGLLRLDMMNQPLTAFDLTTGPAPIGAGLGGSDGAYLRASVAVGSTQFALTSADPTAGSFDASVQGLIVLDLAAGTFATRLRLPTHGANQLSVTPAGW